jgi:hypothetical protein
MNKLLAIFNSKKMLIIVSGIILLLVSLPTVLYFNKGLFFKECEQCQKCEQCEVCDIIDESECPIIDDEKPDFYISPNYKLLYITELMYKPKTSITNFKEYKNTNEKEMIRMVLNKLDYFDQTTKYEKITGGGYVTKEMFDQATLELFGPEITLNMEIVDNDIQSGISCAIWDYNSESLRLERASNECGGEELFFTYDIYEFQSVERGPITSTVKIKAISIYQEDFYDDEEQGNNGETDTFIFSDNGVKIGTLVLSNSGNESTNRDEIIRNYLNSLKNKINTYVYTYSNLNNEGQHPALTKYEIIK